MIHRLNNLFARLGQGSRNASWALFRILVSAMFMTHGYAKLFGDNPQPFMGSGMTTVNIADTVSFPMPMDINALYLAGAIELFGGLLLLIGLWTHIVALIAFANMIMAYLIAHPAWFPTLNNGELAAMYFLAYLVIFAFGPGPYSVDARLAGRWQEKH